MRVLMMTDIEGVSGVVTFKDHSYPDGRYYEHAMRLLTAEVNAAVEGALEAGATDVLVFDGHGSGGIWFEDLHPKARLLHGRPLAERSILNDVYKTCDVSMIIGQHAMAGVDRGNLNHTQSSKSVEYYKLNDRFIGEIAQFALHTGALGLPMIFLSGDDAACREAEELIPGITTASVKEGLSRNSAISLSAFEARRRIGEGIRNAVRNHRKNPVALLKWEGPFVLEKRFFHTDTADQACTRPGVERVDSRTVRLRSDNIQDIIYA